MKMLYVDWQNGKVETQYRGARTVRFVQHMKPETLRRLCDELNDLSNKGYYPSRYGTGWLYAKGAAA